MIGTSYAPSPPPAKTPADPHVSPPPPKGGSDVNMGDPGSFGIDRPTLPPEGGFGPNYGDPGAFEPNQPWYFDAFNWLVNGQTPNYVVIGIILIILLLLALYALGQETLRSQQATTSEQNMTDKPERKRTRSGYPV